MYECLYSMYTSVLYLHKYIIHLNICVSCRCTDAAAKSAIKTFSMCPLCLCVCYTSAYTFIDVYEYSDHVINTMEVYICHQCVIWANVTGSSCCIDSTK